MPLLPACCQPPPPLRCRGSIRPPACPTAAWIPPPWTHKERSCRPAPSRLPCAVPPCRPLWRAGASSTARAQAPSCRSSSSPSLKQLYPLSSPSSPSSPLGLLQPPPPPPSSPRLSSSSSSRSPRLSGWTSTRAHRLCSRAAWVEMWDIYRPPNHHCHMTRLSAPECTRPQETLWPPSLLRRRRRQQRSREWVCRAASAPQCPSVSIYSGRCRPELCPRCARPRRQQLRRRQLQLLHPRPSTGSPPDLGEILSWAVRRLSKTRCVLHQIYDPIFFPFHFLNLFQLIFKVEM